ncbi:hypothetical protein ACFQ4N_09505 [Oceanobacillus iheyensis]|uniref:hypothetical protein n=1 Tax=Bacteria TaxID=2 RepID=UPI001319D98C|nr:hypothetical protein [Microbulbifer pacificus]
MSVSIDGELHRGQLEIKYGEEFPEPRKSTKIIIHDYGECLVYITAIGIPQWTNKMTVVVPFRYYITQILKPNKTYEKNQKRKKSNLTLVKR